MPENKIIHIGVKTALVLTILYQPFFVFPHKRNDVGLFFPAVPTEIRGYLVGEIGVDLTVKKLQNRIVKYLFQSFVALISRALSISVTYPEFAVVELVALDFLMDGDIQFLGKIIKHPHVVIAGKHLDFDARVAQFGQLTQKPDVTAGRIMPVLKPIIKQVTEQENMRGILPGLIQPGDDFLFPFATVSDSQMKVGGEVND